MAVANRDLTHVPGLDPPSRSTNGTPGVYKHEQDHEHDHQDAKTLMMTATVKRSRRWLVTWIMDFWHKSTSNFSSGQSARRQEYLGYFNDEQRRAAVKEPSNFCQVVLRQVTRTSCPKYVPGNLRVILQ